MTNRMNEYRYSEEVQWLSKPWGTAGFEETEATSEVTNKESILKSKVDENDQLSNAIKRPS